MVPGNLFEHLSPHVRLATAVAPFFIVMLGRMVWGRSSTMTWLITLSTVWFAINVFMAPYSAGLRQDIRNLSALLP